jgi:hypothetical protein
MMKLIKIVALVIGIGIFAILIPLWVFLFIGSMLIVGDDR